RSEVNRPGILQLHIRVIQQQAREVCVHHQAFRMHQIPFDANFAVRCSVSSNALKVKRREQKWVERNILQTDFAVERVGIHQTERVTAGQSAIGHRGVQLEFCDAAIGMEISVEAANDFLANTEIHNANTAVSCE